MKRLLAKKISLKVIQTIMEQDITAVGNKNKKIKNKDRWNCFHHKPMLPLLEDNHRLPLLKMAKHFIWIEETGKHINELEIEYMINTSFHVNKSFINQVEKCMNNTFGAIKKSFIKST